MTSKEICNISCTVNTITILISSGGLERAVKSYSPSLLCATDVNLVQTDSSHRGGSMEGSVLRANSQYLQLEKSFTTTAHLPLSEGLFSWLDLEAKWSTRFEGILLLTWMGAGSQIFPGECVSSLGILHCCY